MRVTLLYTTGLYIHSLGFSGWPVNDDYRLLSPDAGTWDNRTVNLILNLNLRYYKVLQTTFKCYRCAVMHWWTCVNILKVISAPYVNVIAVSAQWADSWLYLMYLRACLSTSGPYLYVFTASYCQYGAYIRRESFNLTNSDHLCVISPLHPESGCYKQDRLLIMFRDKLPHHTKIYQTCLCSCSMVMVVKRS